MQFRALFSLAVSIDGEIATGGLLDPVNESSEVHFLPARRHDRLSLVATSGLAATLDCTVARGDRGLIIQYLMGKDGTRS